MGMETHSHLLAPAAPANFDWWLPSGHHHLSITEALSKQTIHQQRIGRLCHTALVSPTFPHLCWLLDKDPQKNNIKCLFCLLIKAWTWATSWEWVGLCNGTDFCCCVLLCVYVEVKLYVYELLYVCGVKQINYYCLICRRVYYQETYSWLYYNSPTMLFFGFFHFYFVGRFKKWQNKQGMMDSGSDGISLVITDPFIYLLFVFLCVGLNRVVRFS